MLGTMLRPGYTKMNKTTLCPVNLTVYCTRETGKQCGTSLL